VFVCMDETTAAIDFPAGAIAVACSVERDGGSEAEVRGTDDHHA